MYRRYGKRWLDVALSATALSVLSPVFAIVAILIRIRLGSPVFFRQPRPGRGGQTFELVKFRTMTDARDADGSLLSDAARLTSFGRFLRNTSLDELPEFFNVLTGRMSLVGPRPLLTQYLARYSPEQRRRHEVRPGITGWSQVNGRNLVNWEDRLAMDVWYVDNLSLGLDLKILWMTIGQVLRQDGISAQGHVTMPEFRGSEQ